MMPHAQNIVPDNIFYRNIRIPLEKYVGLWYTYKEYICIMIAGFGGK